MSERDGGAMRISDITLADFMIMEFSFKPVNEDGERKNSSNIMALHFTCEEAESQEDDADVYDLRIEIMSAPIEGTAYYSCNVVARGLFRVAHTAGLTEEAAIAYLQAKGEMELYNTVRSYVAASTASGVFGTFMLPSIVSDDSN